jgi:hypothetical protein
MKNILTTYEAALAVWSSYQYVLGVQYVLGTGKYMGLPSMIGRSKKTMFNFIKERVWRKINSSSSKCLSRTRSEVLIKSVLQSIL